ncbi:LOW QUALITY PROTEIN: Hypothetical protein PHPALM_19936 [Phytophthora palmivora]|uniref:Uncharacterized protein n=1 Tax=Phytophthora palmivora TaxID=4796 RepID=A0A2P4XG42_9STRA|nr:LOW QUALITY PROTEIN: Hypothetical protein PHPALM_19936 [Phytophthora palmivora]
MAMILKTACWVPGTPSSAPNGLEKRKLGTAAKIRERKRKRAAARKESQGHAECGRLCGNQKMSEAAGGKVTRRKKAAGAKAKRAVGGLFSEAIRAAMAEITEIPVVTASTVSSVASDHVTVTPDYATTIKTWRVARINDRRDSPRGQEYHVLWLNCLLVKRRYYQRTWEPRQQLLDDNFAEELDLVDRWKASSVAKFKDFWPKDEFGQGAIGADTRGLCTFNALKRAAELAGRADIVTQDDIDTFVADEFREHGVDLTHGTSWTVVLRFLRRLRDAGRDFIFKAIDKDNFTIAGRRGAPVLEEVPLHSGLYIVVAYNHSLVGHAFVLSVQGKKGKTRQIFDLKDPKPVSSAMVGITFVACIRPFVVFKKK